jgi:penicillin amidase
MSDPLAGLREMAAAAMFPVDGEIELAGLERPVTVRRDAWGVPYVEAASLDDLWFAQGVVTAGERLFQLDLALRAATGRLSEVFGDRTLAEDRFARTVGFHRAGARIAGEWDADSVRIHRRFRQGVAAWIEAMPAPPIEYTMLDLEPELPDEPGPWSAAYVLLSWGLSGNALQELLRAWITERAGASIAAALMPPMPEGSPIPPLGPPHGMVVDEVRGHRGRGSNAWAVAPSRTRTGGALLANDPHLDAIQPGVWLEMHLSAPGYRARGVALPWAPGIVLGTTAHHAWGATNVGGDVQDLFVEELSDDGGSVRRGQEWAPLVVHGETIDVRGAEPEELTVRESSHGPLLESFPVGEAEIEHVEVADASAWGTSVALAWTGSHHAMQPSLVVKAASATSFDEFRRAATGVTCPGLNFVYADVEGTIGYTCTGVFPVRRNGDGTTPVPAGDGDHSWIATIAPEDLPWTVDPERGFLVTANDRPHDDSYPHLLGRDFHLPHRAGRIAQVLDASDDHDVASSAALQTDTVSPPARDMARSIVDLLEPTNEREGIAADLLRGWDGDVRADSTAAAVFQMWSGCLARRLYEDHLQELFERYHADREIWHTMVLPGIVLEASNGDAAHIEAVRAAFDDAIAALGEELGDDVSTWRWGALHRLRLTHPLAAIPGLESLFTAVDVEIGGDETTIANAAFDARHGFDVVVIPSWRAVYDLADLDRSVGVLPAGVSGNPASPHWNDQAPLWLAGRTHPLPFSPSAVEAAATGTLELRPAGSISG